ncbi:MAG: hypothetical protein SNJ78_10210 [Spirochaetales bacterium]
MKIILDGQPLSFTLEGEQNLMQILKGVAKWLSPQKVEIAHLQLNGKSIDHWDKTKYEQIPIQDIEELQIITQSEAEQELREIEILLQYFQLLQQAVSQRDTESFKTLWEEYPYAKLALERIFREAFLLEGIQEQLGIRSPNSEEEWKLLTLNIQRILTLLETLLTEITHPYEECRKLLPVLEQTRQEIEQTSILLQTGRDREAIRAVLTFIEILSKTIRILQRLKLEDPEVQAFSLAVKAPLQELNEAFQHKDSVLIGDLLEYEIAPKIEDLKNILKRTLSQHES